MRSLAEWDAAPERRAWPLAAKSHPRYNPSRSRPRRDTCLFWEFSVRRGAIKKLAYPLGSGQAVRRLTLDQEIEGSNPSSPANLLPAPQQVVVAASLGADVVAHTWVADPGRRAVTVQWAPDSSDKWAPDPGARDEWALDSPAGPLTLGAAIEHFLTAKAAEGASPKTIEWYRMVLGRAGRDLGADRSLDALTPGELRTWLIRLRETLSPI